MQKPSGESWPNNEPTNIDTQSGKEEDRITKREAKALKKLQKKYPELCKNLSEKEMIAFVFGRKLDIDRAAELLQKKQDFLKKWDIKLPITLDQCNPDLVDNNYAFSPGVVDKSGRPVMYLFPGNIKMKDYTPLEIITFSLYCSFYGIENFPVCQIRQGLTIVESIKGMSLGKMGNSDINNAVKDLNECFPNRIKAIYLVDPPKIVKVLMKIAKTFVKKKIMKRVVILKEEDLKEHIGDESLLSFFGGSLEYEGYVPERMKNKEILPFGVSVL